MASLWSLMHVCIPWLLRTPLTPDQPLFATNEHISSTVRRSNSDTICHCDTASRRVPSHLLPLSSPPGIWICTAEDRCINSDFGLLDLDYSFWIGRWREWSDTYHCASSKLAHANIEDPLPSICPSSHMMSTFPLAVHPQSCNSMCVSRLYKSNRMIFFNSA